MNATAYLKRIGYSGPLTPNSDTLRALHRAHLFNVPFENLDIGLKRVIECDEDKILHKIVEQKRGGFCYEMNGAFAALLRELGFHVTLLSAAVNREDGSAGPEFDHLALRVDLDEPWLADVGFGDSFVEPLRLQTDIEQPEGQRKFRIARHQQRLMLEKAEADGVWLSQFSFTLQPRKLQDFAPMCHYHQTSSDSPFTRKRVCTLATPDGRITLADGRLISTRDGVRTEEAIPFEHARQAALEKYFKIKL